MDGIIKLIIQSANDEESMASTLDENILQIRIEISALAAISKSGGKGIPD